LPRYRAKDRIVGATGIGHGDVAVSHLDGTFAFDEVTKQLGGISILEAT